MLYAWTKNTPEDRPFEVEGNIDSSNVRAVLKELKENDGIVRDFGDASPMVSRWPWADIWVVPGDDRYAPLDTALRAIGWKRGECTSSEPITRRFLVDGVVEEQWFIEPDWENTEIWPETSTIEDEEEGA